MCYPQFREGKDYRFIAPGRTARGVGYSLFEDALTGSSFTVLAGETIEQKLVACRARFGIETQAVETEAEAAQ
jgi:hypothetical protein